MVKWKHGDILDTLLGNRSIVLIHQVNCQGQINSGLAKQIIDIYPRHYVDYLCESIICKNYPERLLGNIVSTHINNDKLIVGLFGQNDFGYTGKRYTNYDALSKCLYKVYQSIVGSDYTVVIPYKLGCGLGGGDWLTVYEMIKSSFKDCNVEIWRRDND